MFLNLSVHKNYDKDIAPYLRNGILIDTCVVKEIIDGVIARRVSKKQSFELEQIEQFFATLKLNNKWDKFFITPQILTEICKHVRSDYERGWDHKKVIDEIMPIIKAMGEQNVSKDGFLKIIEDAGHLALEAGDISIFVATDDFLDRKEKVAILTNDGGINERYEDSDRVMLMDYQAIVRNL